MGESLHNSLIDILLLVGIDDNGTLQPAERETNGLETQQNVLIAQDIFTTVYEVQVLAALSARSATFPLENQVDHNYPPGLAKAAADPYRTKSGPISKSSVKPINEVANRRDSNDPDLIRSVSIESVGASNSYRKGIHRKHTMKTVDLLSIRDKLRKNMKHAPLPMASENFRSLATLCFPDGAFIKEEQQEAQVHHLVLTDVTGNKTYATCMTYYTASCAWKADFDDHYQLLRSCMCQMINNGHIRCQVPHCIVLISKFPYFTTLKECLSRILHRLKEDHDNCTQVLKEAALQLTMTPVAPPGLMSVQFQFFGINIRILPPDHNRPLADFGLNLVFQCLSESRILSVLTVLLMQKRVVFLSQDYVLLTIVCESFLQFIQPFRWELPYSPVLPYQCLDFLDAPGSYIFGIHINNKDAINEVTDLLIVDLDGGELEHQGLTVPSIPADAAAAFKASRRYVRKTMDLLSLGRPVLFNYEDEKIAQDDMLRSTNRMVQSIFLELMVNLFACTLPYLMDDGQLKKTEFLQSCPANSKPFYQQVTDTTMFRKFAKERFVHKKDAWSMLEEKKRLPRKAPRNSELFLAVSKRNSFEIVASTPRKNSTSDLGAMARSQESFAGSLSKSPSLVAITQGGMQSLVERPGLIKLPNFMYPLWQSYHNQSIKMLSTEMQKYESPGNRAALLYLRAMFQAASGNIPNAVQDFFSLESHDVRLFPFDYVAELLALVPDNVLREIHETQHRRRSIFWDEVDQKLKSRKSSSNVDENLMLMNDQDLEGFSKIMHHLGVDCERDAADRLFNVLSLGKMTLLTRDTVDGFIHSWRDMQLRLNESTSHLGEKLEPGELLVKFSNTLTTSYGQGRVALTTQRIFFVSEGSSKMRVVCNLADLQAVEKTKQKFRFSSVDAVKFVTNDDKPFMANLKLETCLWRMITMEMCCGRRMSNEMFDSSIIHQARLNALFIDAAVNSDLEHAGSLHEVEQAAEVLCYFIRRYRQGHHHLSDVTKSYLHHFIDPNFHERERVSIECLLYIPGNVNCDDDLEMGPELWCGMGNGNITIFNASTWEKDRTFQQSKTYISCMVLVNGNRIWAGSFDCTIYIIDHQDRISHQSLSEHRAIVSDIVATEDNKFVFSASIDGKVVKWNSISLQPLLSFNVPSTNTLRQLLLKEEHLLCCSRETVKVFAQDGKPISHSLPLVAPDGTAVELDCFLLIFEEIWVGCRSSNNVRILNILSDNSLEQTGEVVLSGNNPGGISKMIIVNDKVWIGTRSSSIYICDLVTHNVEAVLDAHKDSIRSMIAVSPYYAITGASSADGKVALWRATRPLSSSE